jgi:uncharacterized membrane protein
MDDEPHRLISSIVLPSRPPPPLDPQRTFGQRAADAVARTVGSWPFIIGQSAVLVVWAIVNLMIYKPWDPYPFILMNLVLSLQAAFTAPMIMMSQNREAMKDRHLAQNDLWVNIRTGYDVYEIRSHLNRQDEQLGELLQAIGALIQARQQAQEVENDADEGVEHSEQS